MKVCFKKLNFKKITSTNDKAKELAKRGLFDVVILAEEQTKGKGRFKRKWFSSKGGLYFSILLKQKNTEKVKYLTFIAAISVVKAIKKITGLKTKIKWPNDVYFNKGKLCGILTESVFGKEDYVIVGVGININQSRFNKKISNIATSLKILLKKEINKEKVLNQFLKEFNLLYNQYKNKKYKKILREWKYYYGTIGKDVKVISLNKNFYGKVIDVDNDCNLILRLKNNKIKKIIEGDVFVLG
jgi:BirA family biotin operon repressor/biotin-[acetyl-CoA-carboxylase] ligase